MIRTIALLFLLVFAGGCDHPWDLDRPFRLQIQDSALPHPELFRREFADAIGQLGGTISPDADQIVYVWWNPSCSCIGCRPTTTATTDLYPTDAHYDGFQVCPRAFRIPDGIEAGVADVVHHEMGHVLRYHGHAASRAAAIMSPLYCDRTDHRRYQEVDLDAICSTGLVLGGVCQNRQGIGVRGSPR